MEISKDQLNSSAEPRVTRSKTKKKDMLEENVPDDTIVINKMVSLDLDHAPYSDNVNGQLSDCQSKSGDLTAARLRLAKAQLIKRKMIERLEIEARLKVMETEQEIELAQIECSLLEEDSHSQAPSHPPCLASKIDMPTRDRISTPKLDDNEFNAIKSELIYDMKSSVSNVINFGLPKLEMSYFDGHPKFYWTFIRQFDSMISSKINDKGQLLSYLLYYCKGRAKDAIESCVTLSVDEGYSTARQTLYELFGQEHMVAKSYIDEIVRSNRPVGDSADELTEFTIKLRNGFTTLSQMGYVADLDSPVNLERIVSRLPMELQCKWVEVADKVIIAGREPSFKDLLEFVDSRARIARTRYGMLIRQNQSVREHKKSSLADKPGRWSSMNAIRGSDSTSGVGNMSLLKCPICNQQHKVTECAVFAKLSVADRRLKVRDLGLCFICLKIGHIARRCLSGLKCNASGCQVRHHSMLHINTVGSNVIQESSMNHVHRPTNHNVYFGVVPVRVSGPLGTIETYAFLDSGSDTSLVSEELMCKIGLGGKAATLNVTTVNGTSTLTCREVELELLSLDGENSVKVPRAYSIYKLPVGNARSLSEKELVQWAHLRDVSIPSLADKTVNILIGCEVPDAHWVLEQRTGGRKSPFAVKTHLGWMVMGPTPMSIDRIRTVMCCCSARPNEICDHLERLYEYEFSDLDSFRKDLSVSDKQALTTAQETTKFTNGHFEVGLPWKYAKPRLTNNYSMAARRLECLKRRFIKDNTLWERYKLVMNNHLLKGHIVEVPDGEENHNNMIKWYIPHHPVLNPRKPEKLRVVFDCAAKHQGTSLNDQLLQGPNMLSNLVGTLLRFRRAAIAIAADIEEMFLQVRIPMADRGAMRLLWWKDGDINNSPAEFHLTVHPFGAVSSPFCADFALRRTVQEFGSDSTGIVKNIVDDHFYVDDCLVSVSDVSTAILVIKQLSSVLRKGGFRLTKWVSNNAQVLETIPPGERASSMRVIDFESQHIERTLGLCWDTSYDSFVFKVNLSPKPVTRRGILSTIASLYDPLGLVAPYVLPAKQLLQRLCKLRLSWDEDIPEIEGRAWNQWLSTIEHIGTLSFPRCLQASKEIQMQLHIFCDAAETGYGVAAYIRTQHPDSTIVSRLVMAKARVAPLKVQTIPRLELTAATLAARMSDMIQTEMRLQFERVWYWCDSTVVLHYINNKDDRYRTFVANRLAAIHRITKPEQWRHIPSGDNVADWTSRGLDRVDSRAKIWVQGPDFLNKSEDTWPQDIRSRNVEDSELEVKRVARINTIARNDGIYKLIEYYSDWTRLLKAIAWWHRFKSYIMMKHGGRVDTTLQVGFIKTHELDLACKAVVMAMQDAEFNKERRLLSTNDNNPRLRGLDTGLKRLNPILVDNILRVGGRLQGSRLPEDSKFPMILPSKHHITELVIRHYHIIEGHVGATQLLASLREKFWILKGGAAVRRVVGRCIVCKRISPRPATQIMAPLPSVRLDIGDHPFTSVGVDYFGPLLVKRGRGTEKRYGCLFTCLKIRAIHLEVAHTLTTDSFLMALMRFAGRRGFPKEIFSDNGTNLVGANNELKLCLSEWSQNDIHNYLLRHGTEWHFNPPHASHRGGVWERMIRTVRRILNTLSNQQVVSDECLTTFLTEAEKIVNNRPLTPITDDANDLEALTPSRLLLLRDNYNTLDADSYSNQYVRRWRTAKYLADIFWKRWVKEYIPALQQRQKWLHRERDFKIGDLVIILTEMNSRNRWPLGLITEVFNSSDDRVRSVQVKTASGYLTRDIRKLCLLEAADGN